MNGKFTFVFVLRALLSGIILITQSVNTIGQTAATFEDLDLKPNSYWNGSDGSGGFESGGYYFYNTFNSDWGTWSGFSYSNQTDNTTSGYANQYSAFTGSGYSGSPNYAVIYASGAGVKVTDASAGIQISGFFATNTTYGALSMKEGDMFSKKFGGDSGNDPDWFKLTVSGYLKGEITPVSVEYYLADFRFDDNRKDYIVDTWKWVDLKSLGNVDSISFSLSSSDVGDWGMNTPAYFAMDNFNDPLFAPQAGIEGTTAIHRDSSVFKAWAISGTLSRGPQDISNPSSPLASAGDESLLTGKAGTNGVVSLGDGGTATLTFQNPIYNGDGPDFAIFENGFISGDKAFLELAFVEVSSDGINFYRFPSVSLTDENIQTGSFALTDARKIHNLAGKYVAPYGTPFDLEDLKDTPGLDIDNITHVRVIDVVGSINPLYATFDSNGNKINDPFPTAFASGGFDLDAVGVIHCNISTNSVASAKKHQLMLYPNPAVTDQNVLLSLSNFNRNAVIRIYNIHGELLIEQDLTDGISGISTTGMKSGVYILNVMGEGLVISEKLIIE